MCRSSRASGAQHFKLRSTFQGGEHEETAEHVVDDVNRPQNEPELLWAARSSFSSCPYQLRVCWTFAKDSGFTQKSLLSTAIRREHTETELVIFPSPWRNLKEMKMDQSKQPVISPGCRCRSVALTTGQLFHKAACSPLGPVRPHTHAHTHICLTGTQRMAADSGVRDTTSDRCDTSGAAKITSCRVNMAPISDMMHIVMCHTANCSLSAGVTRETNAELEDCREFFCFERFYCGGLWSELLSAAVLKSSFFCNIKRWSERRRSE